MSLLPTQILPETDPIGTDEKGRPVQIAHNWYLLVYNLCLQVLGTSTASTGSAQAVAVGPSPFQYQAPANGMVVVSGGTVSKLTITRGSLTVTPGPIWGQFRVSKNDLVTVTYSKGAGIGNNNPIPPVAPTVTFFQG